jgi:hypothetical protein
VPTLAGHRAEVARRCGVGTDAVHRSRGQISAALPISSTWVSHLLAHSPHNRDRIGLMRRNPCRSETRAVRCELFVWVFVYETNTQTNTLLPAGRGNLALQPARGRESPPLRFASTRGLPSSTNTSQMFMARPAAERGRKRAGSSVRRTPERSTAQDRAEPLKARSLEGGRKVDEAEDEWRWGGRRGRPANPNSN